jgi:hypothetical protein
VIRFAGWRHARAHLVQMDIIHDTPEGRGILDQLSLEFAPKKMTPLGSEVVEAGAKVPSSQACPG